jgi:hypothetical protein
VRDRASRILPLTELETAALAHSRRGSFLLAGYPRSLAVEVTMLGQLILRVARL